MLKKDNPEKQMVYYQAGIGTYTSPSEITTFLAAKVSKCLDEAIAWDLDAHVMAGYEFLMQNYKSGDRICLFGFSRGAYTARSLAGMIHKVGLLTPCNHQQVPFAYKMFTRTDDIGWEQSNAFKKAFSIDVDIEFIGVWDTVNSVGLIPKRLPFTSSNTSIKTFRHALALDEHRAKFTANFWNKPDLREQNLSVTDQKPKKNHSHWESVLRAMVRKYAVMEGMYAAEMEEKYAELERKYAKGRNTPTDVEEVWFAGCHCDVGGGSVPNSTTTNLARIPLRWMIRECFKTHSGILFNTEGLRNVGLSPGDLFPKIRPRPPALPVGSSCIAGTPLVTKKKGKKGKKGAVPTSYADGDGPSAHPIVESEEELDLADALSPIYDQLSLARLWWLLEYIPIEQRRQELAPDGNFEWVSSYRFNLGRGRSIPFENGTPKIHRSVQTRMDAQYENGKKYTPKAWFDPEKVIWVD
ncbi:hypothetical protein BD779DRAFT_829377 [Infundibulicybe gibba]|nr:hypothetical protein BD779DRAFT_829377 [Infundibulicybe gibba]